MQKNIRKRQKIIRRVSIAVLAIVIVGVGYLVGHEVSAPDAQFDTSQHAHPVIQPTADKAQDSTPSGMMAQLSDVTKAAAIQGVQFNGIASGKVVVAPLLSQGSAIFKDLPAPINGSFYEGWIVTKGKNPRVVSTGKAILEKGEFINDFTLKADYNDNASYILTLEPNDGNSAPADHILEGKIQKATD
jgi:hypothetical protein